MTARRVPPPECPSTDKRQTMGTRNETTAQQWLDLADRCEKATGPDREIDATIAIALFGWREVVEYIDPWGEVPRFINKDGDGPCIPERYAESLDAITALIEREIPHALYYVSFSWAAESKAATGVINVFGGVAPKRYVEQQHTGTATAAALALCAAFCRAMAAKVGA